MLGNGKLHMLNHYMTHKNKVYLPNNSRFCTFCLGPLFICPTLTCPPKTLKLFGYSIFWLWAYLMRLFQERIWWDYSRSVSDEVIPGAYLMRLFQERIWWGYSRSVSDEVIPGAYLMRLFQQRIWWGYSRNVSDEVIPAAYLMRLFQKRIWWGYSRSVSDEVIPEAYLMRLFKKRVVLTKLF